MNIKIRLLDDNEISIVNEVYNTAYGNIRPDSYFEWEFIKGPSGKAIYVIAEDLDKTGNKIIGTQAAIPLYIISSEGKRILTAKSEDTFVHPDYRGHKLFDKMYEVLFDQCKNHGIEYIWGFTYAKKPFLKLGFTIPFDTIQGLLVFKWLPSYKYFSSLNEKNSISDKVKILALTFLASCKWKSIALSSFFKKTIIKIEKPTLTNRKELYYETITENKELWCIDQNQQYLNWRLDENPYDNLYEQISVSDGATNFISGLINIRKEKFAYLEDLFISKVADKKQIIGLAKTVSKKESIHTFRFWGFDTNSHNKKEIELLRKAGFLFVKKGTSFVWKELVSGPVKIDPNNLLLSRLYTQGNR